MQSAPFDSAQGAPGKILCLCGGVGGAKLALGFSKILSPGQLTIIINTGDDFEHLGFFISPDIDTVLYTLAGISNTSLGWGIEGETWQFMAEQEKNGGETWFKLGDKDLQTHRLRKQWLSEGLSLSEVTSRLCKHYGVKHAVVPMSDDPVSTLVKTGQGELAFQHYFVREQCTPQVTGFYFKGIAQAQPSSGLLRALQDKQLAGVVICPSNPFVSIDPILSLQGVREILRSLAVPVIAVSPIIGGQAVKGPTAKMMDELQIAKTSRSIARHYRDILDVLILDNSDAGQSVEVEACGVRCLTTRTLMKTERDKIALAEFILAAL
jgi:LPPG:FO 2-phospho-L-lactate transferase